MSIIRSLPPSNATLRAQLYEGSLFHLDTTPVSLAFVDAVNDLLEQHFGPKPRLAQDELDDASYFERVGAIRRVMFLDQAWRRRVFELIESYGFAANEIAFDPPRLRCIRSDGHLNERAKSMYYPHRDTWYSHPPGIVTWWLPLHDCTEDETFAFYPQCWDRSVPNDSEIFDYDHWVAANWDKKIGWQNRSTGLAASYPQMIHPYDPGPGMGFAAQAAESLLFAGCHLHGTKPQSTGRTRFSVDFRIVHLGDHHQGQHAPILDNRSRGSALVDYVRYADLDCDD